MVVASPAQQKSLRQRHWVRRHGRGGNFDENALRHHAGGLPRRMRARLAEARTSFCHPGAGGAVRTQREYGHRRLVQAGGVQWIHRQRVTSHIVRRTHHRQL